MKIGVIADDFTGATDAASFMVKSGLSVIQVSGVEAINQPLPKTEAIVVSLKTRSCDKTLAISQSLQACDWLLNQGCKQIYFKYCSTFDSTAEGNIGPVTQALMARLDVKSTILCPALPVNGRTVYQGNLFVYQELLNESGMKNHPITPMTDSNLMRLMTLQTGQKTGLLSWQSIQEGEKHASSVLESLSTQGVAFIVCDALNDNELDVIAQLCKDHRLVTGGSGLAGALAGLQGRDLLEKDTGWRVPNSKNTGVVLSGSCSVMTNQQVATYQKLAASYKVDVDRCVQDEDYADVIEEWVINQTKQRYYPMIYATVGSEELREIQCRHGAGVSDKVEALFHQLVVRLHKQGYQNFISAGGETSGTVTQALEINQFKVGVEIAPGVPWVSSLDGNINLALKSGNFGNENFFREAQDILL
ncbi:four-carbon acid sugar kinase family protein [Vibrio alginolyticus]|nr:four-carbon acid sugar kinase family protein [Vibrio alginolyticus]ELB2871536.1 four-carbon acid sugar kinase family protein [Vibrio alginolyticus]